jgi:hypothetical protein
VRPLAELRRAWRLYQTDSRGDTLLAVVLVAVVAYPLVRLWWKNRQSDGSY